MHVLSWLNDSFNYIFEAAVRTFSPTGDSYPNIGIQPYDGDPYSSNWT